VTSDTFNLPATANTINVLEIDAAQLDAANDFDCVRCQGRDAGRERRPAQRDLPAVRRALPAGDAGRPQGRLSGPIS
jgi:hypothetical protein